MTELLVAGVWIRPKECDALKKKMQFLLLSLSERLMSCARQTCKQTDEETTITMTCSLQSEQNNSGCGGMEVQSLRTGNAFYRNSSECEMESR